MSYQRHCSGTQFLRTCENSFRQVKGGILTRIGVKQWVIGAVIGMSLIGHVAMADIADGVITFDISYLETVSGLLLVALGLLFVIRKLIKYSNRS